MSEAKEESLYEALNKGDLSAFLSMVEAGARITPREENISRLFYCLEDVKDPKILPVIDRLSLDLRRYGGKPLRAAAHSGNRMLTEYLLQQGADINFHKPDMVFPYASTPVTEAARENHLELLRYLVSKGADITLADKYGDRPYTLAVQNKNREMAEYLRSLEPEDWHNEQEKLRELKSYHLPAAMTAYFKNGALRLEFPERESVRWMEFYPYLELREFRWKRKKLLSLMAEMDNYSDYVLLWSPRDKRIWYLDTEQEEFCPLASWEAFIADPGFYLNGMVDGEFSE